MWHNQFAQLHLPMHPTIQQKYIVLNESLRMLKTLLHAHKTSNEEIEQLKAKKKALLKQLRDPSSAVSSGQSGGKQTSQWDKKTLKLAKLVKTTLQNLPKQGETQNDQVSQAGGTYGNIYGSMHGNMDEYIASLTQKVVNQSKYMFAQINKNKEIKNNLIADIANLKQLITHKSVAVPISVPLKTTNKDLHSLIQGLMPDPQSDNATVVSTNTKPLKTTNKYLDSLIRELMSPPS